MHYAWSAKALSTVRNMIGAELARAESARLMRRLDCVLLFLEGRGLGEIADWFGVGKRSVQRWVRAAQASGVDGLLEHHNGGRPPKLTREQERAIRRDLQGAPSACGYSDQLWTGKRLVTHLAQRYAIEMSVRSCQRMIARSRTDSPAPR